LLGALLGAVDRLDRILDDRAKTVRAFNGTRADALAGGYGVTVLILLYSYYLVLSRVAETDADTGEILGGV